MPDREELIKSLVQLDPATLEDVVNAAYRQRFNTEDPAEAQPDPQATLEEYAHWLARRHLATDAALERVIFLPAGAPENEIRLLEVNRFLNAADTGLIEPLDFTPEMDFPYRVFVADITSEQWEHVRHSSDGSLPPGWCLDNYGVIVRG